VLLKQRLTETNVRQKANRCRETERQQIDTEKQKDRDIHSVFQPTKLTTEKRKRLMKETSKSDARTEVNRD
jgi:hypothetical protein